MEMLKGIIALIVHNNQSFSSGPGDKGGNTGTGIRKSKCQMIGEEKQREGGLTDR